MILVDTNVLIYAIQVSAPHYDASRRFVQAGAGGKIPVCLLPQVLLEFLAIITDKRRVDNPAAAAEATELFEKYASSFPVLSPSARVLEAVISLMNQFDVKAQHIHDCHLVAQMIDTGLDAICTYNLRDFEKYPISALTPDEFLSNPPPSYPFIVQDKTREEKARGTRRPKPDLPVLEGRVIGSLSRTEIYKNKDLK